MGSPPLTRGKAPRFVFVHLFFGITPAYAGKSEEILCPCEQHQDHPRLRGEKQVVFRHAENL